MNDYKLKVNLSNEDRRNAIRSNVIIERCVDKVDDAVLFLENVKKVMGVTDATCSVYKWVGVIGQPHPWELESVMA